MIPWISFFLSIFAGSKISEKMRLIVINTSAEIVIALNTK